MKKATALFAMAAAGLAVLTLPGCSTANSDQSTTSYTNNPPHSTLAFPDAPATSTDISPIPPAAGQGNQPDRPPQ